MDLILLLEEVHVDESPFSEEIRCGDGVEVDGTSDLAKVAA